MFKFHTSQYRRMEPPIFKLKTVFSCSLIILEAVAGTDKLNVKFAKDKVFLLRLYFFARRKYNAL